MDFNKKWPNILLVGILSLMTLACASGGKPTNEVAAPAAGMDSKERSDATAAIARAEVFESQKYASEQLNEAYDLLDRGDVDQSTEVWTQSKVKADEATGLAAPQVSKKWLDELEKEEQDLKGLRADLYMPEYYTLLMSLLDQCRSAVGDADWDVVLELYQKTYSPLKKVATTLDQNLMWLNRLKQETEGIMGEGIRKNAADYVPEVFNVVQEHLDMALANFDNNDLAGMEGELYQARHYAGETLRLLDLVLNLAEVDASIDGQAERLDNTVGGLRRTDKLDNSTLKSWSSDGFLQETPLDELSMEPLPYLTIESNLKDPGVDLDSLALNIILPVNSHYQMQQLFIAQEFVDQQAVGDTQDMEKLTPASVSAPVSDGIELLEQAQQSWEMSVTARNSGDLEKARYYLQESSRHLNNYTTQYSVLVVYSVVKGDCLWRIAARKDVYADAYKWPYIYQRNRDLISNPNIIYPDQKFIIPEIDYEIPEIDKIIKDASDLYENSRKS